jgi:hypothetical protein
MARGRPGRHGLCDTRRDLLIQPNADGITAKAECFTDCLGNMGSLAGAGLSALLSADGNYGTSGCCQPSALSMSQ